VVTGLLSACAKTPSAVKPPLRVAWSLWPGYYPMAIAVEKGFFEKHGVQVEPVFYSSYGEQAPALASGKIDGAAGVLNDMLLDRVAEKVQVVLIADNSDGSDQIVAAPGILSAADIRGKRIGTVKGTFGEFFAHAMLEQKGILPAEVTFVDVAPEAVPVAISNTIDLGHTYEPYTSQARAKGYTVIFSSAETPGLIVDVFAFRKSVLQERPADAKAFIAAWFEAVQYWQANPAEGNAIIAKATGQKVEEISVEGVKLFGLAANLKAFKAGNDTTSVYFTAQKAQQFLIFTGDISIPVKVEEILNASFLQ
jgi:NitT/TauT family transport system substrate-binding protein